MITVAVFLGLTIILLGTLYTRAQIDYYTKYYAKQLEEYVITNHSDNDFVKNGFELTEVQNNVALLDSKVAEIDSVMIVSAKEFGIPGFVYNLGTGIVKRRIEILIATINTAEKATTSLADKNNTLTVSSVLNGTRAGIMNFVNTITLIIVIVLVLSWGIYILVCLYTAKTAIKRRENEAALGEVKF